MRIFSPLAAVLALLAAPVPALAGDVAGTVYDARGLPQADVTLAMAGQQAVTGADGAFVFTGVPAGDHPLAAVRCVHGSEASRGRALAARRTQAALAASRSSKRAGV